MSFWTAIVSPNKSWTKVVHDYRSEHDVGLSVWGQELLIR